MKRIKNYLDDRKKEIIKVSSVAAGASIALAILEAIEGLIVGSVSMIIDGLSHVTEAGNAVITALGTYLAGKPATKKHPFGFGRIEYISALVIALLVIDSGIAGLVEGIKDILNPGHPHITVLAMAIVAISMVTRIVVGRHDIHTGKHHNSRALQQVGKTEVKHAILSAATLLSAVVYLLFHVYIGGYIATLVSASIVWGGIVMLKDMFSSLLGEHVNEQIAQDVKKTIMQEEYVDGVFDLILHNYGPDSYTGSVHIAVQDSMTIDELDRLTRHITDRVKKEHDVSLTGVGIYSVNEHDEFVVSTRQKIADIALANEFVQQIHGFYLNQEEKDIRFDVVVSYTLENRNALREEILEKLKKEYPEYSFKIVVETDFGMLTEKKKVRK